MLIVQQIEQLVFVGFSSTRSSASKHNDSGCDIVVEAFSRLGIHMSHNAIEAVWKQRDIDADIKPIAELFYDGILAQLSSKA